MVNLLLALALLQASAPAKSVDDHVAAFLKGDKPARAELVKLGAFAIRPLLKARERAPEKVDPLLVELKKAAAYPSLVPLADRFQGGLVVSLSLEGQSHLGRMVSAFHDQGAPVFSDRFDPGRLLATKALIRGVGPQQLVDEICRATGLDYGHFHNFIVIGLPERLWASRAPAKVPELDAAAQSRVRDLIEKLGDDSIEVRESAARELAKYGRPVIPLLEAQKDRAEREIAARCESILHRLRAPAEGAFGPSTCVRQKLAGEDQALFERLRSTAARRAFFEAPLAEIAARLKEGHGVECEIAGAHRELAVTVVAGSQSLLDLLSVVTQSRDLDFMIMGGKVVIDGREVIEKKVAGKK